MSQPAYKLQFTHHRSHPEAILRLASGYPEATLRLPRGYPEFDGGRWRDKMLSGYSPSFG